MMNELDSRLDTAKNKISEQKDIKLPKRYY